MTDFAAFNINSSVSQIYAARIRVNCRYGSAGGEFGIKTLIRGLEVENVLRAAPFDDQTNTCAWTDEVFLTNGFHDWIGDPGGINEVEVRVYRSGNTAGMYVHGVELVALYENYADAVVRPPSQDFVADGGGGTGCLSDTQLLVVQNSSGWITLPIDATISGPGSAAFSIVSGADQDIEPSSSGEIEVRFDPSSPGVYSAQLNLGNSMGSVPLNGTGVDVELSTIALSFGPTPIGGSSSDQSFTIRNSSHEDESYSLSVALAPNTPFLIVSGGGDFTLPPLATRTISVRFLPELVGLARADVFLGRNLGTGFCSSSKRSYVQLLGDGSPAVPCITSEPALFFGQVAKNTSFDRSITITNQSSGVVDLVNASIQTPFSFAPGQDLVIDPGSERSIAVRFAPAMEESYFQPLELGCGEPVWLEGWGGPTNPDPRTWVDFSHTGSETGSPNAPYNSLIEGVWAVQTHGTMVIRSGTTPVSISIDKGMRIEADGGPVTIGEK